MERGEGEIVGVSELCFRGGEEVGFEFELKKRAEMVYSTFLFLWFAIFILVKKLC